MQTKPPAKKPVTVKKPVPAKNPVPVKKPVPNTEIELLERCQTLAGKTLKELSFDSPFPLPKTLLKAKGWMGQLIEWHLGANAHQLPLPDFMHLGIELKTLPINIRGEPKESTFVCTAPISLGASLETWETSRVRQKLMSVLWVPIEADAGIAIGDRRVCTPLLWRPSLDVEAILKKDWEELTEMLLLGEVNQISARFGTYLHIRPKAAHSRVLNKTFIENDEGQPEYSLAGPKGFYLRTNFTKKILQEFYR